MRVGSWATARKLVAPPTRAVEAGILKIGVASIKADLREPTVSSWMIAPVVKNENTSFVMKVLHLVCHNTSAKKCCPQHSGDGVEDWWRIPFGKVFNNWQMWHWSVMNWISVELFNTKKYQLKTLCNWWYVASENVGGYYDQLVLMDIWVRFENKMQPIRKRYWHRSVTLFFLGCVVPQRNV